MTWAQATARTHQEPDGFSARHRAQDHFATSVSVGDHVARVVLEHCEDAARRHGVRHPYIVDVGSGDGRLLRQLLDLGFPAGRLIGVDVRPPPADLPVGWIQGVAPACLPDFDGLLFAHEFLDDIGADRVVDGRVETVDAAGRVTTGGRADEEDLAWLRRWTGGATGLVGRARDEAWVRMVAAVGRGEAIAVDFRGDRHLGYRRGRRVDATPDGGTDICAGVELRSCRARTGGLLVPQHRVFAGSRADSVIESAELAVLRDRGGLGAFNWLFTDVCSVGSRP